MSARGFIVGAPRSGAGKTSVTIGLMRAFRRRGLAVAGVKSGPDYIDPGFHAAATGRAGVNLDSWAMAPALLDRLLGASAEGADLVIAESAMGLFDGIEAGPGRSGAASDLAARFGLPVLLVLDVSGQSRTAAAVALGFARYDPRVRVAGVVLNRVGSARHTAQAGGAIRALGIPVLGAVPRDPAMSLPERHLGLVQAREHATLEAFVDGLADTMERALDLDAILALAAPVAEPARGEERASAALRIGATRPDRGDGDERDAPEPAGEDAASLERGACAIPPPGQRIAVAEDAAFSFLYPHLARQWRAAGAELVFFSPLADEGPDETCDACWLPGGYPELHAGRLAQAARFREGVRAFAQTKPVHGECGGFMALGAALEDASGATHPMLGLLGHTTSFAVRRMNLGYRDALLLADCAIGRAGTRVRGHEFHYSRVLDAGSDAPLAELRDGLGGALGPSGARRGWASGTFFHAIAAADESGAA